MATDEALSDELKSIGVAKSAIPKFLESLRADRRQFSARIRARMEGNKRGGGKVVKSSIGLLLGGALAEPIRRQVVGWATKGVRGQAVGMAVLGVATSGVFGAWMGLPFTREIGDSWTAIGGWLGSVSMYGDEKNKDAVVLALEGTTKKAKKEAKEAKEKKHAAKKEDEDES